MTRRLMCLALLAGVPACPAGDDTARGVAQRFVDEHYVRINLEAAKAHCTGVALRKLQDEQVLTQGQTIDEGTRQPAVHYRLAETRPEGEDRVSFIFEAKITVEGADGLARRWLVTAKKDGGVWKVSNFQEFE